MSERAGAAGRHAIVLNDCWNRIGVRGDRSCPELKEQVHCHNCPVFSRGAADMLDSEAPAGYFADRTDHFSEQGHVEKAATRSVVIFRVASQWLALPAAVVIEIAALQPVHSLPHRSNGVVLGLASIRGELLVCVSLARIVGAEAGQTARRGAEAATLQRMLVLGRDALRVVCPVDAVHGLHRFAPSDLRKVPSTIEKATVTYSTALLSWQGQSVGTLDEELLFYALRRSLE